MSHHLTAPETLQDQNLTLQGCLLQNWGLVYQWISAVFKVLKGLLKSLPSSPIFVSFIMFKFLFIYLFFSKEWGASCRLRWVLSARESLTPTEQSELRRTWQVYPPCWSNQPSRNRSELWSIPKVSQYQWHRMIFSWIHPMTCFNS